MMTIDDLIADLSRRKKKHGNLRIFCTSRVGLVAMEKRNFIVTGYEIRGIEIADKFIII